MLGFLGLQLTAGRSLSLGLLGGSVAGWRVDVTYRSFSNATAYRHPALRVVADFAAIKLECDWMSMVTLKLLLALVMLDAAADVAL